MNRRAFRCLSQCPFIVVAIVLIGCVSPKPPVSSAVAAESTVVKDDCDDAIRNEFILTFLSSAKTKSVLQFLSTVDLNKLDSVLKENPNSAPVIQLDPTILSPNSILLRTNETIPAERLRMALEEIGVERSALAVEPNAKIRMLTVPPDDPYYPGEQCGLVKMSAEDAWKELDAQGMNASGVYVAIVDSGIYDGHTDLKNAVKVTADDVLWHGTHVAGLVGARENDKFGMSGVAWKVNLRSYQLLDEDGDGSVAQAIEAVSKALSESPLPDVVLLAWGTSCKSVGLEKLIHDNPGVLFVAAAGNDRQDIDDTKQAVYPAAYDDPNILTVMATTCDDTVARFSAAGANNVDIAAPGEGHANAPGIRSTVLRGRYGIAVGTSISAAYAAGGAALVKALNPSWKADELKKCLMSAVDPLGGISGNPLAGRCKTEGRLNLGKAAKCP